MNMLLEGCLEPAKGSCEADADARLPARHATLFDRLQGTRAMPSKNLTSDQPS